jgi:CheY-like chemotaxis protein
VLRTPFNSILILAQLLSENKNNTLAEKDIEFARNIYNSGTDLLNLINEILDLSKVEAGKLQLEIAEVPFQSISHNLLAMFSEVAKNKSINFSIEFDNKALPSAIISDKQRIEQILKNLLSNAFKFTDDNGTITLKVNKPSPSISFKNENLRTLDHVVAFSVTDTGIGIPEDKCETIFKAFQQVDGSTKRKYGGTGLGLSISLELSHALGGEIQLQSTEGKGSTFTLYLPLQFDPALITKTNKQIVIKESIPHETKKETDKSIDLHLIQQDGIDDRKEITENDRVILIIEDDEVFAKILLDLVREGQGKGVITQQGNTALSYARHFRPYAIFLDMNLPVMDGGEVLKQFKNDPELRHIPVLIISQYNRRIEGLALGAFDYLQKPITPADFLNAFDKLQEFVSKKMKKMLIIEDSVEQNKAIKELIGNGDVKSFSAYSGQEAYAMLQKDSFDCVIVDLGLPDMSGFDLLEKIRANDKLNKMPVIVYTGRDLQKEDNLRLNKLADTVVLKTADSHERLLDEAMLFLHRVESRLPMEKQNIIRKLHHADKILKDKTVLLVDDDIRNIYSLTNALEDEGMKCLTAENGIAAITMVKDNPVDLVLMDVMMPHMDGFEATLEIRKIMELSKLPIIALTAKAMKGDKEKCLAVGMSDYISKPINVEHLLSLMRVWLYR